MSYFLKNGSGAVQSVTFTFNSQTGEAKGQFNYRTVGSAVQSNTSFLTYQSSTISVQREEDVGDMLRSNYIILRDRNIPTDEGYVTEWNSQNKLYSHRMYHDISGSIHNVSILYKNMYL